jgi:LPXTG-motif cell wall-anchored protein
MDDASPAGLTRRGLLRRGAAVSGALVWTVPVVQSISPAAFAAGSPAVDVEGTKSGRDVATGGAASGLPQTGDGIGTAHLLAAGTALVAGGTAVVARTRRTATAGGDDAPEADIAPARRDGSDGGS